MKNYINIMKSEEIPVSLKKYISATERLKAIAPVSGQTIPDICWITNTPVQKTIPLLCDYFEESGLIEFSGERRCIQIRIDDPVYSVPAVCAKIRDLLSLAGGYHGSFKGLILIDMVPIRNFNNKYTAIMQYIKANTPGCLRIITGDAAEHKINDMQNMLYAASYNIRTIRDNRISADKAVTVFRKMMDERRIKFDAEAMDTILSRIVCLTESRRINSTEDIAGLCDDMSFFLLGENGQEGVSERMINMYFEQSTLYTTPKNKERKIGFSAAKEV